MLDPSVRRYLDAQVTGDRMLALRVIIDDALVSGAPVPDLHINVIEAAQHELGRLWQCNKLTIAEVNVATSVSQFVMSYLYHYFPRQSANGKKVLIGCVEGELHEMGPRLCTDFLEMAGFDVRFFGANVPTTSIIELIERESPDLVGLSVTVAFNLLSLQRAVCQIRDRFGGRVKVAAGGQAVMMAPLIVEQLGVLQPGKGAREATTALLDILLSVQHGV